MVRPSSFRGAGQPDRLSQVPPEAIWGHNFQPRLAGRHYFLRKNVLWEDTPMGVVPETLDCWMVVPPGGHHQSSNSSMFGQQLTMGTTHLCPEILRKKQPEQFPN